MVSLAKVGDFDAIADLNVEAYREFAGRMSPDGWRDMEASLRDVKARAQTARFLVDKKRGQATFLREEEGARPISRRVVAWRPSYSPLVQTSRNSYFLSDVMDTLQSLQ